MINLREAIKVLEERLDAVDAQLAEPGTPLQSVGALSEEHNRLLLSGFDVDLGELGDALHVIEEQSPRVGEEMARGETVGVGGIWLQGFLTGLIAARRVGQSDQG